MFRATSTTPGPSFAQPGQDQTSSRTHAPSYRSRRNLSFRINSPSGRAARSWVALTSAIRASSANLPALACMPSAISTSPIPSGSSPSTLHVEKTAAAPSTSNSSLASLSIVSRESYWVGDTIIQVGKWPLWSKWAGEESFLSFWNGLIEDEPWLVLCEHFFDQVIHSNSSHVSDGYT